MGLEINVNSMKYHEIKEEGRKEGESRYARLTIKLAQDKRLEDIQRAATDEAFRRQLFKEYDIE